MKAGENLRYRKKKKGPKVPRYYPLPVKGKFRHKGPPPPIPKFAHWGFTHYHPSIKVLILSVFLAFVSLTTPFWAYVDDSTFGLWMYCSYSSCTSIHDNLVEGGAVPAWYHMTQGSFCIGTVACLVALGILVHNVYGKELKMTSTVYTAAVCVLGISVIQMSMALYTFTTYFEHTNFLYHVVSFEDQQIDYHGAFYCGLLSTVLNAVAAIIILVDDDITKASKRTRLLMQASRGQLDAVQLQAIYEEMSRGCYYDGEASLCNRYGGGDVFRQKQPYLGDRQGTDVPAIQDVQEQDEFLSQLLPYPEYPPPPYGEEAMSTAGYLDQAYYDGQTHYINDFNYLSDRDAFLYDTIIEEEIIPLPPDTDSSTPQDKISSDSNTS